MTDQDAYKRGYLAGLVDALRLVGGADEAAIARFCAERVAELEERTDVVALVREHVAR